MSDYKTEVERTENLKTTLSIQINEISNITQSKIKKSVSSVEDVKNVIRDNTLGGYIVGDKIKGENLKYKYLIEEANDLLINNKKESLYYIIKDYPEIKFPMDNNSTFYYGGGDFCFFTNNSTLYSYNVKNGIKIAEMHIGSSDINLYKHYSYNNKLYILNDELIKIYDESLREIKSIVLQKKYKPHFDNCGDDRYCIMTDNNLNLCIIEINTGRVISIIENKYVNSCIINSNNIYIIGGDNEKKLYKYSIKGELIKYKKIEDNAKRIKKINERLIIIEHFSGDYIYYNILDDNLNLASSLNIAPWKDERFIEDSIYGVIKHKDSLVLENYIAVSYPYIHVGQYNKLLILSISMKKYITYGIHRLYKINEEIFEVTKVER